MSSIMSYDAVVYESYTLGAYTFPHWASVVGWSIAASSMLAVPVTAVYQLITLPAINYRQVVPASASPGNGKLNSTQLNRELRTQVSDTSKSAS